MKRWIQFLAAVCVALAPWPVTAMADDAPPPSAATQATQSEDEGAALQQRAAELIFAVNRKPERPFETSRSVDVITSDEIWRRNGRSLVDVLEEEAGIFLYRPKASGGTPIIRGLDAEQVLIMVDGVRINNATWGSSSKEYLNLIDLAQVERIEIVRGVVGVLGTDSLGGVVNIVTRKGPDGEERFGGSVSVRYASADRSAMVPLQVFGQAGALRYIAGATMRRAEDLEGGGSAGVQPNSDFGERAGHLRLEYAFTSDKTLTFGFQGLEQTDVKRPEQLATTHLRYDMDPTRFQLGTLAYRDLSEHPWADSSSFTIYWNEQKDGRKETRTASANINRITHDDSHLLGASAEFSKFLGLHGLVYGTDFSTETVDSTRFQQNTATGGTTADRGRFIDGARYRKLGIYLNDHFSVGKRLSASLGARLSRFSASGTPQNTRPEVGSVHFDVSDQGMSGSAGLVFHATSTLNLVANYVRGSRAPSLEDFDYSESATRITLPNSDLSFEKINSWEAGLKHDSERWSASAMYYRNDITDHMVAGTGLFHGLPFLDLNGNGQRDPEEPSVRTTLNANEREIRGWEADFRYKINAALAVHGNYTKTTADDVTVGAPLQRTPPAFGILSAIWQPGQRWSPWTELVYKFANDQNRVATNEAPSPGYDVFTIRGGAAITPKVKLNMAVENIFDQAYRTHGSYLYLPGRSFIVTTQWNF